MNMPGLPDFKCKFLYEGKVRILLTLVLGTVLLGILLYWKANWGWSFEESFLQWCFEFLLGDSFLRWYVGFLLIALLLGEWIIVVLRDWLHQIDNLYLNSSPVPKKLSGQITGIIERAFFAIAVAFDAGGSAVAMIAWITVKNTAFWQNFLIDEPPKSVASSSSEG